ncbi:pentatricopeptide repeat-containing protein [Tripterygium wilfordii]|uniref:Pentatricopeptide repeat-containing protein n=1 Tax=Tripterygium wilfordii TaxID=458696 RepID=A0A7J7DB09_TRIWF|nr:pentatricopeptide repeat-containing protein At3g29230-like [Tripterygium wilfordii]KAF5743542.1 pentatricopeptide repeat-containing protein [Tripterygium wilfordii]
MPCNLECKISHLLPKCTFLHLNQIHALIITDSLSQNFQLCWEFLRRSTEFGTMEYSNLIFSQFGSDKSNEEFMLRKIMIRGYAHNGPFDKCLSMFDEMPHRGLKPDHYTYPYVLNSCCKMGCYRIGKRLHCQVIKSGFGSSFSVAKSLFNMYIHMPSSSDSGDVYDGKIIYTRRLFDDIIVRPVEMWNKMIFEYVRVGDLGTARQLFDNMPQRDVVSWNSMISGYSKVGQVAKAGELFERMPEKNVISWTSMVGAYAEAGELEAATELFEKMPCRNVVTWNTMITCYTKKGDYEVALDLFGRMQSELVVPDGYTFVSVLSASSHLGALEFGKRIHHLIGDGSQWGPKVGTALVEMYAQCGDIDRAFTLFIKIRDKDVFGWNVAIKALAIHGRAKDAVKIFLMMQKLGFRPNDFTFSTALFACSHGGLVEEGRRIFHAMEGEFGISPKPEHFCCFIDLLSRNGLLEEAQLLVKDMPFEPDIAIWGALLGGCRVRSDSKLAEEVVGKASELEVNDSGVHVLLSNIYASMDQRPEALAARGKMEERNISKKAGSSVVL